MRRWRPSSSGASTFSTTCCRRASPTSERSRRSSSSITSTLTRRRSASARRWACPSREPRRPSRREVRRLASTFDKLETRGTLTKTKRFRPGDQPGKANHLVKLPKGAKPVTVSLSPKEQVAWRMFGKFVQARRGENPELEDNLLKAHIKLRPEEYLAVAWMNTTFAAVGSVVAAFALALFLFILRIDIFSLLIFLGLVAALPIFFSYMHYFGLPVGPKGKPRSMAKKRGTKIDKRISGAMSFISAMASADVPVDVIFKELSKQTVYGEVAREAEWITRDTELLGLDILSAIRKAAQRSPSSKFQDFLQGVVTTSTSGGQLKPYFLVKAEQFEKEDRLEMRKKMETLGMLAESFVTVVVAFPLFLVVIMAIMALISKGSSGSVLVLLYVVVALMIPLSQFGFFLAKKQREIKQIERRLPDFLRDVAEAGRFGMTLADAIVVSGGGRYGKLTPEIKKMAAQITWGVPATEALHLFATRVKTPMIERVVAIIVKSSDAGGDVADVLTMVSHDTKENQLTEDERRIAMSTYIAVIYISFMVFLVTIWILNVTFLPKMLEASGALEGGAGAALAGASPLANNLPEVVFNVKIAFFIAVIVHALGDGVLAGVLDTGKIANGLRHSFIMLVIAMFAFLVI